MVKDEQLILDVAAICEKEELQYTRKIKKILEQLKTKKEG